MEWVFSDFDLVANGFSEHGCCFKTREEAEHIAEGIERETSGVLFIDRIGGENATLRN